MRLRLNSLRSRIAFLHLLAIAIAAMLVPLANYLVINQYANRFEARALRDHATTISRYLSRSSGGWQLHMPADITTLYRHGLDGLSYAVVDGDGRLLFSSGQAGGATLVPANAQHLEQYRRPGATFYGLALRHDTGRHTIWIKVAQNIAHPDVIFDDIVSGYLGRIAWFTVMILALLLVIDVIVIRRALRPVLQSSEVASAIEPSRSSLRLPETGMPSELLPLIAAMNQALDRLEQGIRIQREFTADAAHELRTPLAVLRARIETMQDQTALAQVKSDIAIMAHVVDQLMEMAEVEGANIAASACTDLHAVAADVAAMLAGYAISQGKAVALTGTDKPVRVHGDPVMIFRAIRNLADNAIKYTKPETTVVLKVNSDGSLTVTDQGPGISEGEREMIFRRFWRADRNAAEGSGLGLAIVYRIAEMHRGLISVENNPDCGATFKLALNLMP